MGEELRWRRRVQDFERALVLLGEPVSRGLDELSDLEREGTIQRFEVALELAWKTLSDYLAHAGVVIRPLTPRAVIKAAFAAGLLADGQVWIDMLDHRNLLAHTYDHAVVVASVDALQRRYFPALQALLARLRTPEAED